MYRILYLITELNVGGAETMLYEMARRIDKNLYDVTVLSLQDKGYFGQKLEKNGIKVKSINMRNKWDILKLIKLFSFLKKNKYDIVHSFMFHANILSRILSKLYSIPINISSVHTIEKGALWHLPFYRLTNFMVTMETVICNSAKKYMINKTKISSIKIKVIKNGVELSKFENITKIDNIKEKYGLPNNKEIVGTIGSLTKVKNHILLINAASYVIKAKPDILFVIVGNGPELNKLKNKIKSLSLEKYFYFLGFIENIPEILSIFDCFVLSSLWEGVPVSLLEAMAAKKAAVVTDVGGMGEVVINNKTGLVVPENEEKILAESILNILNDKNLAKNYGDCAHNDIKKNYAIESMIRETEEMYLKLIKDRN